MNAGPPVTPELSGLRPLRAVPGGKVAIRGGPFVGEDGQLPTVRVGELRAHIVCVTPRQLTLLVPPEIEGGLLPVRIDEAPGTALLLDVGVLLATGVHQVDSPAIGPDGSVYLTCSGTRGQQTPVSIYRLRGDGMREMFVTGLTNATSLAIGPDGFLYASSRFDGTVSRIDDEGHAEVVVSDLGIACGLAFAPDGVMFVGDRSGTVFRVESNGDVQTFATLPASAAAYHLATDSTGTLFVTGPTLSPRDHVYRISSGGEVSVFASGFGRPQGLAFDRAGRLHVVEALAGEAGLYRLGADGVAELIVAAPSLVGVAIDSEGRLVVASNDTAWQFDRPSTEAHWPTR